MGPNEEVSFVVKVDAWNRPVRDALDDRIKNTERSIGEFENATKGLRKELEALKEQKRLADLDAENKRLKIENSHQAMLLSDQKAKIGRLESEKSRLQADLDKAKQSTRTEYTRGYSNGYRDGFDEL